MEERPLPQLSEAQMEIMLAVWKLGDCTVADVLGELRRDRPITRNTVHTMMTRLADKGWLQVVDAGSTFTYRAAIDRDSVQQNAVEHMVKTVFDGSSEGLLMSLLQNSSLNRKEIERIQRMIREAEERS